MEGQKWGAAHQPRGLSLHSVLQLAVCSRNAGQTTGLGEPAAYGIWGALVDGKTHNRKLGATINTSRRKGSRPDFFPFGTLKKILGDKRTACAGVCGVRPGGLVS